MRHVAAVQRQGNVRSCQAGRFPHAPMAPACPCQAGRGSRQQGLRGVWRKAAANGRAVAFSWLLRRGDGSAVATTGTCHLTATGAKRCSGEQRGCQG